MKVLWSVFITFPEVANLINRKPEYACTWVKALAQKLRCRDDIELAIVSASDSNNHQKFVVDNITFYFLSNRKKVVKNGGGEKAREEWDRFIQDFCPDIIHIHGTESLISYELIKMKLNVPVFITLQGILTSYYPHEYGGIDVKHLLRTTTLRDAVRFSGVILDRHKLKKRTIFEQEMLKSVAYAGGRTLWDKTAVTNINPNINYYYTPEMIRENFFNTEKWDISRIRRHQIFMHQGFKPIKGFHFMLEALAILLKKYPDVELIMSGANILDTGNFKKKLLRTGYSKYLTQLINKYNLSTRIQYTGIIDAKKIVEILKTSHVMVLPSAIENSPNSLVEAMLVGAPCVASYVGGVPEMIKDKEEGLLYCYNEPTLLAEYISQIFDSDELAVRLSDNAYGTAIMRHEPALIERILISNYCDIINDYKSNLQI